MIDRSFKVIEGRKGVLLLHGMTGAPGEMKLLAKRLIRQGFSVACPQLAGHGADEAALLKTDWRDWLRSARLACDQFATEVDEVYVAGICAGGALGLMLAAERDDIRGAAVYSMTFEYDGWNMPRWVVMATPVIRHFANLPLLRRISFAEPPPFGIKDEVLRERVASSPTSVIEGAVDRMPMGSMYQLYQLGRQVERVGGAITTPTLILHAREDDMSHPRNAHRLQKALAGPVQLHMLDDSYHMIHVDLERDLVAELTASFFDQVTVGGPAMRRRTDA